jgi:hypothetical protein
MLHVDQAVYGPRQQGLVTLTVFSVGLLSLAVPEHRVRVSDAFSVELTCLLFSLFVLFRMAPDRCTFRAGVLGVSQICLRSSSGFCMPFLKLSATLN